MYILYVVFCILYFAVRWIGFVWLVQLLFIVSFFLLRFNKGQ